MCLNISKIKCFEKKYVDWFTGKGECTEGKGGGYCSRPVILGPVPSWALHQVTMQEETGGWREQGTQRAASALARELPRVMGRSRQRRKCCCLHHVVSRGIRQSPGQLENPNIHKQRWHMFCSFWPEGKSFFAQAVRPIYLETSGNERCKTWKRMMTRKNTKDVWLLNFL